jgi:hypothetical protein
MSPQEHVVTLTLKIKHRLTFTSSALHYYNNTLLTDSKVLPSATSTIVAELHIFKQ